MTEIYKKVYLEELKELLAEKNVGIFENSTEGGRIHGEAINLSLLPATILRDMVYEVRGIAIFNQEGDHSSASFGEAEGISWIITSANR